MSDEECHSEESAEEMPVSSDSDEDEHYPYGYYTAEE